MGNKMMGCAGADRLQTGMRGAFGKTYGTVARVEIGQILLSVRARDVHQPQVMEALRRAKYKFPGRQRLCVSENWGFTKLKREMYEKLKAEGRLVNDGINVQIVNRPSALSFSRLRGGWSMTASTFRLSRRRDRLDRGSSASFRCPCWAMRSKDLFWYSECTFCYERLVELSS